jgi:hypothetical protein
VATWVWSVHGKQSNVEQVAQYIAKQKEHHAKISFRDEFIQFLKANRIEYASIRLMCTLSAASRAMQISCLEDPRVPLRYTQGFMLSAASRAVLWRPLRELKAKPTPDELFRASTIQVVSLAVDSGDGGKSASSRGSRLARLGFRWGE